MKKELDPALAVRLINHGPVVLVSSVCGEKKDITPVAWHMPVKKDPPEIALLIGRRHFIYECIQRTGEFAVNIPCERYAPEVVKCGACTGRDTDKFEMCGFDPEPCEKIGSVRIRQASAYLECKASLPEKDSSHSIVLGKVVHAAAEEEVFSTTWNPSCDAGLTLHHLGDRTFCVPRPGTVAPEEVIS